MKNLIVGSDLPLPAFEQLLITAYATVGTAVHFVPQANSTKDMALVAKLIILRDASPTLIIDASQRPSNVATVPMWSCDVAITAVDNGTRNIFILTYDKEGAYRLYRWIHDRNVNKVRFTGLVQVNDFHKTCFYADGLPFTTEIANSMSHTEILALQKGQRIVDVPRDWPGILRAVNDQIKTI